MILVALSLHASTTRYDVKFKGMTLGEVVDITTAKELYLKAKVTSTIARFMLGKEYFVFYGGEKPDIKNAKFKKDKKMMMYAFAQSLINRPKHKVFKINDIKNITLNCNEDVCEFIYYKNNHIDGKGKISFDENDAFVSITEELSGFEIVRR